MPPAAMAATTACVKAAAALPPNVDPVWPVYSDSRDCAVGDHTMRDGLMDSVL